MNLKIGKSIIFFSFSLISIFAESDIKPIKNIEFVNSINHNCKDIWYIGTNPQSHPRHIPHRIFQTWKTHELSEPFFGWSNTWKEKNSSWEYELWDDKDNREFIEKKFPWFLEKYDSFPAEIYRADAIRYFYLYEKGGVYADLDFECLKSLDSLVDVGGVIFGRMTDFMHSGSIPNAFMASPPKADFWPVMIYLMMKADPKQRPEFVTGPQVLLQALNVYQNKELRNSILSYMSFFMKDFEEVPIQIRPPCELYPLDWSNRICNINPCSYAVTWWTSTWKDSVGLAWENEK